MGVSRAISIEPAADEPARGDATTPRWHGALAGFLSAAVALGIAQLVAGLVRGTTSPVVSVGEWVIDHVPVWVKEFAIRQFGTNDKPMLIAGTVVLLAVFAVVIGILAVRRLWIGVAGIALFGLMGMATAATRPSASSRAVVPALVGTLAAVTTLVLLLHGTLRPILPARNEAPAPHAAVHRNGMRFARSKSCSGRPYCNAT